MSFDGKTVITAIAVTTIDGFIARDSKRSTFWSSPEDKDLLHEELDASEMIVVGNTTYQLAREPLSKRKCLVFTRSVHTTRRENENLFLYNAENGPDISSLLKEYSRVALLGGKQIFSYFLKLGLIDEISQTIEPITFGKGMPMFDVSRAANVFWEMVSVRKLNERGTLHLHYKKSSNQARE